MRLYISVYFILRYEYEYEHSVYLPHDGEAGRQIKRQLAEEDDEIAGDELSYAKMWARTTQSQR